MEWYFENLAIILEEDGNNPAALQGDSKGFEAYANFGQKKLSQEEVDEIFGTDFTKYKEQRIMIECKIRKLCLFNDKL